MLWEEDVYYDQCMLMEKANSVSYVSLTSYFCIPVPEDEKDTFFIVVSSEGLGGLYRTIQFSFFSISVWA